MGEIDLQQKVYRSFMKILDNSILIWIKHKHLPNENFQILKKSAGLLIDQDALNVDLLAQGAKVGELIKFIKDNKDNFTEEIKAKLNTFKMELRESQTNI